MCVKSVALRVALYQASTAIILLRTVKKKPDPRLHSSGLAARLIALCEKEGLTQEGAAAAFRTATGRSTTTNTWARWETTGSVKAAEVVDLAEFFEVDLVWLMTGAGERPEGISAELSGRRASARGSRRDPDVVREIIEEASEAAGHPGEDPPRGHKRG